MFYAVIKALPLKCGSVASIQASEGHYCLPKNDTGPYTHWEVTPSTCPAEALALMDEYSVGDGIYARVPTQVVRDFVKACGGAAGMALHPFALVNKAEALYLPNATRKALSAWR